MRALYCFKNVENGKEYEININEPGDYVFVYDFHVNADELAQYWCSVYLNGEKCDDMSVSGTNGNKMQIKQPVKLPSGNHKLMVGADGKFVIDSLTIKN